MSFVSVDYLFFFPIVVLAYFIIPRKIRMYWLLFASYYFYMSWNAKYGLLLLFSTAVTYCCGLLLEIVSSHRGMMDSKVIKTIILFTCLILDLGILFYFKYTNFMIENVNIIISRFGLPLRYPERDIILPVGISFFVFQSIGYTIDVYRNEIKAEKNLFRYALFISFFPQLVAGPIERSKNLLAQFRETTEFDVDDAKNGLLTIAYGVFMKLAVADNIASVIDPIFDNPAEYSGMVCMLATILFAFQIYCDFNGYTQIAIGSARVLGFKLNPNFDSPYMGTSVKDFWRRWHISLTSWFRDYLYIPLGGGRKGKLRKQINTMIVFLCSGLWHGAGWHYVLWGGINGAFSVIEDVFDPMWNRITKRLSIKTDSYAYRVFCRIITFCLVDFTMLIFRASNLRMAFEMIGKIVNDLRFAWFMDMNFVEVFASPNKMMMVLIPILAVIIIDIASCYGKDIRAAIFGQQIVFRWIIYAFVMLAILYWGNYGTDYEQTEFIYFAF